MRHGRNGRRSGGLFAAVAVVLLYSALPMVAAMRCGWRDCGGAPQADLIVVAVAVDRSNTSTWWGGGIVVAACAWSVFMTCRFACRRRAARRAAVDVARYTEDLATTVRRRLAELAAATTRLRDDGPSGTRVAAARRGAEEAEALGSRALRRCEECAARYPTAGLTGLSGSAAVQATNCWTITRNELKRAGSKVHDARARSVEVADALDGLPDRLARLEARLLAADARLGRLRGEGWRVGALTASLDSAVTLLATAGAGPRGPALDAADKAEQQLGKVEAETADLPARRERIRAAAAELRADLPSAVRDAAKARQLLAILRERYDASCTADITVPDAPTGRPIDAAEQASTMDRQDWDRAEAACERARASHAAASTTHRELREREGTLARLATELDGLLNEATAAVRTACSLVTKYRPELPPLLDADARTLRAGLSAQRTLATRAKPPLQQLEHSLGQLIRHANRLASRAERLHSQAHVTLTAAKQQPKAGTLDATTTPPSWTDAPSTSVSGTTW
jgi:hypothetical protein